MKEQPKVYDLELVVQTNAVITSGGIPEPMQIEVINAYLPELVKGDPIINTGRALLEACAGSEPTPEQSEQARRIRLDLSKIRTGTDKIRKAGKDDYLKAADVWQGAWNLIKQECQSVELPLEAIEKFQEIRAAEAKKVLGAIRQDEINQYGAYEAAKLAGLDEQAYADMLAGAKARHEARVKEEREEAERVAEADRQEKARIARNEKGFSRLKTMNTDCLYSGFSSDELGDMTDEAFTELVVKLTAERDEADRIAAEAQKAQEAENARIKAEAEEARKQAEAVAQMQREEFESLQREQAAAQRIKDEEAERALKAQQEEARIAREASAKLQAEADAKAKAEADAERMAKEGSDQDKIKILMDKFADLGKAIVECELQSDAGTKAKDQAAEMMREAYKILSRFQK